MFDPFHITHGSHTSSIVKDMWPKSFGPSLKQVGASHYPTSHCSFTCSMGSYTKRKDTVQVSNNDIIGQIIC